MHIVSSSHAGKAKAASYKKLKVFQSSVPEWRIPDQYLVKQIAGSVRGTSLRDKASKGHAVQDLGQKVVLKEASLTQEGSLRNFKIKSDGAYGRAKEWMTGIFPSQNDESEKYSHLL